MIPCGAIWCRMREEDSSRPLGNALCCLVVSYEVSRERRLGERVGCEVFSTASVSGLSVVCHRKKVSLSICGFSYSQTRLSVPDVPYMTF